MPRPLSHLITALALTLAACVQQPERAPSAPPLVLTGQIVGNGDAVRGLLPVTWQDIDEAKRLALVRDRKDPRRKAGNDQWVPLLGEAWTVLQRQPKVEGEPRIFPIGESTVSKYFTNACRDLDIPDLHFHDLRHEGASRLFEEGYEIQQVALVTGHKDWRHLRRYTQLKPESLHPPKAEPDDSD
jgi:integrase